MRPVKKCCVALLSVVLLSGGMVLADEKTESTSRPGYHERIDVLWRASTPNRSTILPLKDVYEYGVPKWDERHTINQDSKLFNYSASQKGRIQGDDCKISVKGSAFKDAALEEMGLDMPNFGDAAMIIDKNEKHPVVKRTEISWRVAFRLVNIAGKDNPLAIPGTLDVEADLFDTYDKRHRKYVGNWYPTVGDLLLACPILRDIQFLDAKPIVKSSSDKSDLPPSAITDGSIKPETGSAQVSVGAPSDLNTSKPVSK